MKEDILGEVIEVEKEIQKRLEVEKNKSQEWLEKVKRDAQKEILTEENSLKGSLEKAVKEAQLNAEKKASNISNDAHAKAERLENLSDEILKGIILRHITRTLPGQEHDNQDVKS